MNITEFMSFDLEWFTTLPGILITGGVVVLLIALILFIASNKKDKNKNQDVATVENTVPAEVQTPMDTNIDNNMMMGTAVGMMNLTSPAVDNTMINNDIQSNGTVSVNSIEPVANDIPTIPAIETPTAVTYSAQPAVTNVVDFSAPAVEVPMQNAETPIVNNNDIIPEVTPYVAPNSTNNVEPSMDVTPTYSEPVVAPVEESVPVVETTVQEQPVIYGGANPASVNPTPVTQKPVIYGGANPLENTTTLPRMTNHDAYSASSSNIIQPAVETQPIVIETPVVEPVIAPVEQVTPVVSEPNEIAVGPTVSQVEIPVQPVPEIPASPAMPMTGAEMFASPAPETSDEIETLEF